MKRKIHVVDGDTRDRKTIVQALRTRKWVLTTYSAAEDLIAVIDRSSRGCIVTDLRLPGMSGLEFLAELSSRQIHLPVIALNAAADTRTTVKAMQNGAITVLDKPCDAEELTTAVQLALRRAANMHRNGHQLARARECFNALTEQERTILRLIARGVPNKQIARRCDLGLRTVEARRHAIFQKTRVESLADLVRLAVLIENASA